MERVRTTQPLLLVAMIAAMLVAVPDAPAQEAADTVFIEKDGEEPSNADIAVRLSEATPMPDIEQIVVARDDEFADALASGLLQGDAPLMLVSPEGVQQTVLDHMADLGSTQVVMLGGEAALPMAVEQQFVDAGYTVTRRQGATRIETAIDIAATDAPAATDAIMVRAFAAPNATDPTQAFADSLAAGGMAASDAQPILLTQSETLTTSTREYLAASDIERVRVLGGTAAISDAVVADMEGIGIVVERIAGESRADTAVEIAKARGADSAADVARVTLVQGQTDDAWAGGFAAAAHSAQFDAPIVLGSLVLPPETEAFLAGETTFAQPADPQGIRITCVIGADICREAREVLELPPIPPTGGPEVLLATNCNPLTLVTDTDASTIIFNAPQGCPDLGHPDAGFGVIDAASGAFSYVVGESPFGVSLSADGTTALAGFDFGTVYDLTTDPPAAVATIETDNYATSSHSLSGDGSTAGIFSRPSIGVGVGDFYDIASGTASGPSTCEAMSDFGESGVCNTQRPISDDGQQVFDVRFDGQGAAGIGRFGLDGTAQEVAVRYDFCGRPWPIGPSGTTAAALCDQLIVVVDFDAGTSLEIPVQDGFGSVTGAADDGSLVTAANSIVVDVEAETSVSLQNTFAITVSGDGQWAVVSTPEGIQRIPSADVRP